nr:hypothetical protein [Morganella psychrotolerans]
MMKKLLSVLAFLLVVNQSALAGESEIKAAFAKMDITVQQIQPSPVTGVAVVSTSQGIFLYQ